jgi:hypothetical protein
VKQKTRNVDERDSYENVCARFCAICFFGPSDWLSNDDAPPLTIKYFEILSVSEDVI